MKKNLLLMMLCCPVILAAQGNGVTVSGLAIDAGTVTFNVSWETPMPVELWSDTVWVFVDYNKNGVMERLPLLSGATLTATSPGGKVIEETNNNQGVWVAGNARTQGSFSATVKLLTAVKDVGGACVYGSNYPPVGKYLSSSEISFTGTPEYKVVLERNNKSTYTATVGKNESLSIPNGEAALSFTDKTGAPGTFTCIPMTGNINFSIPASVSKNMQASFVVSSEPNTPNPALITYSWSAPDFSPVTQEGKTFTATASEIVGIYPVTLTAQSEKYCNLAITKDVVVADCTAPGSTVNFTAFSPCSDAATGATWTLQDTRESTNHQNYKVKKMADGHIWMVQDLKFGDKCDKITFVGSTGKDLTGNVTTLTDQTYYGDCSNITNELTPFDRGYMYDWAAAINKSGAYQGSTSDVGCSGTGSSANACQGICPAGWHVPTGNTNGEYYALGSSLGCVDGTIPCWGPDSVFEGVLGGYFDAPGYGWAGRTGYYRTSTRLDETLTFMLSFDCGFESGCHIQNSKLSHHYNLRCVMNY
jgi:uncharacterized protein (TIGR02145 family)